MRYWILTLGLLPAFALLGCGGPKTEVRPEEAVEFSSYHHFGVAAFTDRTGRGQAIADAIASALQQAMYDPVEQKELAEILAKYKPDRDSGLGIEALEIIKAKTSADSIIFGRMAPDWSAASIIVIETSTGGPILHAILRPRGRKKKTFASPDELAKEMVRALSKLR